MTISEKLIPLLTEAGYVQKDAVNEFHGYRYASADKVYTKVRAALAKHLVAIAGSQVELLDTRELVSKKGELISQAIVRVTLTLRDIDTGEEIQIQGLGQGADHGDKAVMKAVTAAVKYALSTGLLISWGDDPEADSQTDQLFRQTHDYDWSVVRQQCLDQIQSASTLSELAAVGQELKRRLAETPPPSALRSELVAAYRRKKSELHQPPPENHQSLAQAYRQRLDAEERIQTVI